MMLKNGTINPLNVYNLRKLDFCPPHFEKVYFNQISNDRNIIDWIFENLEGRFYIDVDLTNSEVGSMCVAFEIPSESSYFLLMKDSIDKIN
jgi:hypothetical protein